MSLDEERLSAQNNFNLLVAEMPERLSRKEDGFSDKLARSKRTPIRKLESLYEAMNELYEFSSKYTPCKKGCSDCCHYNVTISEIEIVYIEKHSKNKRNQRFISKRDFHGTSCPFLMKGSCSIYEVRPFVCRRHVTLTKSSTWCSPLVSNDEKFPLLNFTSIDKAYEHIRRESKSFNLVDIREAFGRE
jgi:Fe-S-cluster containining protein